MQYSYGHICISNRTNFQYSTNKKEDTPQVCKFYSHEGKKETDIMLILHLTNGHRELSHCPAQRVEKSIKKGCKEFFIMNTGLPKQNLEKASKKKYLYSA
jgi:hypothetical protein